ncbi:MAG: molybdopterin-containing oxidoreductase family protein [Acidimicrobiales bacterium]
MTPTDPLKIRTTCPRDCYDTCGMVVEISDGAISRVSGDPDHPVSRGTLCGKCALAYNGAWIDRDARLASPLIRTGPKGSGHFKPTEWDTALGIVADRLTAIRGEGDAGQIVHTHYTGTNSMIAGGFPSRFFNRLGATEVDPDTVCNNAAHAALTLTLGTSVHGFDPRSADTAGCLVVWGANPSASAPHAHRHWIPEFDGVTVVVDPVAHATARSADIHLQVHPGADAALAFALMLAARETSGLDHEFLESRCRDWDQVEGVLNSLDLARLAEVCGIEVATIMRVGEQIGGSDTLIWLGQGLQRQHRGGEIFRACVTLAAATGNLGKPGVGMLFLNGGHYFHGASISGDEEAPTVSHMDLVEVLRDRERTKALITWNNNIAASNPRQKQLRAALEDESLFTVVVDLFLTDTADYADVVLPAASFLEFDDLVTSYFNYSVSAQVKTIEPLGDSLPNQEIFRRLAARMGMDDPYLHVDDETLIADVLERSGLGLAFDELADAGTVWPDLDPVETFQNGVFPTSDGLLHLCGEEFVAAGLHETPTPAHDAAAPGGQFRLLSPADALNMNSSYGNDPKVQRLLGEPTVSINIYDAELHGLHDGQRVTVESPNGTLDAVVLVTDDVAAGVALFPKGRWPKHEGGNANVNVLTGDDRTDIGDSSAIHSLHVTIDPAREVVGE